MTIYSPTYQLPSPELLVGSADGPAAFQALNARLESVMPTLRAQAENVVENAYGMPPGARQRYMNWTVTTGINGWIDVDFRADFAWPGDTGGYQCSGGHCELWINHVQVRNNVRWHNECAKYGQFYCNGSGSLSLAAATTTVDVEVWISVDTSSSPIAARRVVAGARMYGSYATP